MFKKKKDDSRKFLENKLYLARERPDEIFDISSCELKTIPQGIFSVVKVLLKTELYLQKNMLRNLDSGGKLLDLQNLVILDLSFNSFRNLPDEINALQSLEILKVSHNNLDCLPSTLMHLRKLKLLEVQANQLTEISTEVKNLESLQDLNIDDNPLETLPRTLCYLKRLDRLTVPLKSLKYPPKDVCVLGITKIMEFLCREEGISYCPRGDHHTEDPNNVNEQQFSARCNQHDGHESSSYNLFLGTYERKNEERRLRALELERQSFEDNWAQKELVSKAEQTRTVLNKLAEEESRTDAELLALQQKRDHERSTLLNSLVNIEDHAANLIKHLISDNESNKHRESAEQKAFQDHFDCQLTYRGGSFKLRREEVLESMCDMLSVTQKAYESRLSEISVMKQHAISEQDSDEYRIQQVLANRRHDFSKLSSELAMEESIQKEAFANLQNQRDMRAQRLQHQIGLIEQELCRLTLAEQTRKAERSQINQQVLTERRTDLLRLLTQLLDEQQKRQTELLLRLEEMEERKSDDQKDFWLVQYQRLLDSKPVQLLEKIDPDVMAILEKSDCLDLVPHFQRHQITYFILENMTDDDLKQRTCETEFPKPSAPAEPIPSAPQPEIARVENECCICQDATCTMIFLQCGHVCCCSKCSEAVTICPLCRSKISKRIQLQY